MKIIKGVCGIKKAVCRITLDAGSSVEYDKEWDYGIAHILEHMCFQGTNTLSVEQLSKRLGMLGVENNAGTSHNRVSFYIVSPVENIYEASALLKDMIFDRQFTNEEIFEKEKDVVLEEWRGYKDDKDNTVAETFDAFLVDGPLSVPIIGTEKSIKSITLQKLQNFYNTYYKPANFLITLTGPENLDWKKLENIFGENDGKFNYTKKVLNKHRDQKSKIIKADIEQARVFITHKAMPLRSKDALPLTFFDMFFGNDMDSRLFQVLRNENGLCYGAGSYTSLEQDIGFHICWIQLAKENINKAIKLINKEIERFLDKGPEDEEMLRAFNKYRSSVYNFYENSYSYNNLITGREFNGLPPIEVSLERAKNFTKKDVMKVCKKIFTEENKRTFIYRPK